MIKPSLLDVLKENRKVDTDEFEVAVAIKNMEGFVSRPQALMDLQSSKAKGTLSTEEQATLDLVAIYSPLLARFTGDELLQLIEEDIKNLVNEKKQKGLM
jgi:HKD family nuclease